MEVVGESKGRVGVPLLKALDGLLKAHGEKHLP